jgi:ATP-dependent DNA ligase
MARQKGSLRGAGMIETRPHFPPPFVERARFITYLPPMLWRISSGKPRLKPASFIKPCLATESKTVPSGPDWVHEIKHDGYRMQLRKDDGRVRLFTRTGVDWSLRYPWPVEAAAALRVKSCTIDGELVVTDANGISDFEMLQSRAYDYHAFLYGFDLLELDGADLRPLPLVDRKDLLTRLMSNFSTNKLGKKIDTPAGIGLCEHDAGDGNALFRAACSMGLEGIVSKKLTSSYQSGKCKNWVKVKNPKAAGYRRGRDDLT